MESLDKMSIALFISGKLFNSTAKTHMAEGRVAQVTLVACGWWRYWFDKSPIHKSVIITCFCSPVVRLNNSVHVILDGIYFKLVKNFVFMNTTLNNKFLTSQTSDICVEIKQSYFEKKTVPNFNETYPWNRWRTTKGLYKAFKERQHPSAPRSVNE